MSRIVPQLALQFFVWRPPPWRVAVFSVTGKFRMVEGDVPPTSSMPPPYVAVFPDTVFAVIIVFATAMPPPAPPVGVEFPVNVESLINGIVPFVPEATNAAIPAPVIAELSVTDSPCIVAVTDPSRSRPPPATPAVLFENVETNGTLNVEPAAPET